MKMFKHVGIALLGSLLALAGCGQTDLLSIRDTTLIGDTANVIGQEANASHQLSETLEQAATALASQLDRLRT